MKPWERYQPTQTAKPWERYQPVEQAAPPAVAEVEPAEDAGFSTGQRGRGAALANIFSANQSPFETGLQTAGHLVGTVGDVIGEGVSKVGSAIYPILPDELQQDIKVAGHKLAPYAAKYEENLQAFNKENPRAGRNLQAVRELGELLPLGTRPAKAVAKGAVKVKRGVESVIDGAPVYNSGAVKASSAKLYKSLDQKGGVLKPEARQVLMKKAESLADIGGERLTSKKNMFEDIYETLSKKGNQTISLKGAESLDKELTGLIQAERSISGMSPDGVKLMSLQDDLRDVMRNPAEEMVVGGREGFDALKQATDQWSAGKKLEEIENILSYAEKTDNPATSIKAQFRTLSRNKKRMAGYSPKERKFIENAAKSSKMADFLRTTAGSRLISTTLGGAGGIFGGGIVGGMAGAGAGAAVSGAARSAATGLQKGRVRKLQKEVSRRVRNTDKQ